MTAYRTIRARRVFVDSSAYLALVDRREEHHAIAGAIMSRLTAQRRYIVTTNFIVAEAHALILRRLNRDAAFQFLREIDQSETTNVVRVAAVDELRSREIIAQYADKEFSLTDATSFAVMERMNIVNAFAYDDHFTQFGFTLVEPART